MMTSAGRVVVALLTDPYPYRRPTSAGRGDGDPAPTAKRHAIGEVPERPAGGARGAAVVAAVATRDPADTPSAKRVA